MDRPTLKRGSSENGYVELAQLYLILSGAVGTDNPFFESRTAKKLGFTVDKMEKLYDDDYEKYLDVMDDVWVDADFGGWTEEGLLYFQSTHIGPDKLYLIETEEGIVGPNTWWAFNHRSETEQQQKVPIEVEKKVVESYNGDQDNARYLAMMLAYKYLHVKEKPKGSNCSEIINWFKGNKKNWAWCQCYVSRIFKEITGHYPVGPNSGKDPDKWGLNPSTATCRSYAKKLGLFKPKKLGLKPGDPGAPEIGDMYSVYYGNWRGHTGFVVGFKLDENGYIIGIYTLSGNESDKVKEGYRALNKDNLVGFIDPYLASVVLPTFKRDFARVQSSDRDKTR